MKYNAKKNAIMQKILVAMAVAILVISMIPLLKVSFYDRATGDDYGYGAVTRQALIQTHSAVKVVSAALGQVKSLWYSYQGTWFSVFLFAFQPEVFSLKAYWITAWIALALTISSVTVFIYTILVRVMGYHKEEFIITDCIVLFIMMQFVYSSKSAFFWFNGVVHYIVPLALALFSMSCFVRFIQTKKNRYIVISALLMTMLGGMSYLSAFMAPLFLFLVWIMSYKKGRYIWRLTIPFGLEAVGLIISAVAPGNANRGGSGYSVSAGRAIKAVGESIYQGTIAIPELVVNKPMVCLLIVVLAGIIWKAAEKVQTRFSFERPWLIMIWLYLIYCAMYWPGIFAGVYVSGGVPNTIFQVFILMTIIGISYMAGYFVHRTKYEKSVGLKYIWLILVITLSVLTFVRRSTIKSTTDFVTIEYLRSGQADDYRKQMDEFTSIMMDQSVTDAKVHVSNNEQGPLMHMPITDDPKKFTNEAAAQFFGKNSVVVIGN